MDFNLLFFLVDINTLEGKYDQDSFLFCLLGSFMAVFYYDFDLAGRFSELCGSILGVEINQTGKLFCSYAPSSSSRNQNQGSGECFGTTRHKHKANKR